MKEWSTRASEEEVEEIVEWGSRWLVSLKFEKKEDEDEDEDEVRREDERGMKGGERMGV